MSSHGYSSVLVTTDLSSRAALAMAHAWRAIGGQGTVHLVYVLELQPVPSPLYAHYGPPTPSTADRELMRKDAETRLRTLLPDPAQAPGVQVHVHVREHEGHDVAPALSRLAAELGVELVCMATHGRRGLSRLLLGSVAEGMLRLCPVPVLLVRVPKEQLEHG